MPISQERLDKDVSEIQAEIEGIEHIWENVSTWFFLARDNLKLSDNQSQTRRELPHHNGMFDSFPDLRAQKCFWAREKRLRPDTVDFRWKI